MALVCALLFGALAGGALGFVIGGDSDNEVANRVEVVNHVQSEMRVVNTTNCQTKLTGTQEISISCGPDAVGILNTCEAAYNNDALLCETDACRIEIARLRSQCGLTLTNILANYNDLILETRESEACIDATTNNGECSCKLDESAAVCFEQCSKASQQTQNAVASRCFVCSYTNLQQINGSDEAANGYNISTTCRQKAISAARISSFMNATVKQLNKLVADGLTSVLQGVKDQQNVTDIEQLTELKNTFENNLQCMSNMVNTQIMSYSGAGQYVSGITQSQNFKISNSCDQSVSNTTNYELDTVADSDQTADTLYKSPLDPLVHIAGLFAGAYILVIILTAGGALAPAGVAVAGAVRGDWKVVGISMGAFLLIITAIVLGIYYGIVAPILSDNEKQKEKQEEQSALQQDANEWTIEQPTPVYLAADLAGTVYSMYGIGSSLVAMDNNTMLLNFGNPQVSEINLFSNLQTAFSFSFEDDAAPQMRAFFMEAQNRQEAQQALDLFEVDVPYVAMGKWYQTIKKFVSGGIESYWRLSVQPGTYTDQTNERTPQELSLGIFRSSTDEKYDNRDWRFEAVKNAFGELILYISYLDTDVADYVYLNVTAKTVDESFYDETLDILQEYENKPVRIKAYNDEGKEVEKTYNGYKELFGESVPDIDDLENSYTKTTNYGFIYYEQNAGPTPRQGWRCFVRSNEEKDQDTIAFGEAATAFLKQQGSLISNFENDGVFSMPVPQPQSAKTTNQNIANQHQQPIATEAKPGTKQPYNAGSLPNMLAPPPIPKSMTRKQQMQMPVKATKLNTVLFY